ncbi:MAG TPA: hypothetical protein ENK91_04980, partial [Bacteroidetes bacterium]|nr:hypothetical protein [Bacteroidota bacterium]
MALSSYISNDIEKLAEKLAYSIDKNPVSFKQKEYIIVQTEGMSKWLSVKLAEKNGIFANFEFLSPNQILFELFRIAGIRNSEMYKTDNLKWIIFNILDKKEFKSKFKSTYDYYKEDNIKRLQLATKLADLFDQYSIYRPDYILQWNQNKEANVKSAYKFHEEWQRYVWTEVKNIIQKQDNVENREYLLDNLKNNKELIGRIKSVFKRISIFGFSVFTPFHLEVFLEYLPGLTDVNFYLFNPAPEDYWLQDIPEKTKVLIERRYGEMSKELLLTSGNKLLMNLAKTAKEMYLILLNNESFVNNLDNETLLSKPGNRTLLNIIQSDIYNNVKPKTGKSINASLINDGSLSVVSNYTPMREVEVLYNYLLKQIETNGYKPNDFIVMTSNIDTYTPYIKAVFDNSPVKLPYTIADRSYVGTDNLVGILKQILLLQKDEFTSENVMQILEFDEVKNKFDIKNLFLVREIIKKANIRHGIEGNINDETVFVSWRYGLNRIVMGYAIKTDELYYPEDSEIPVLPLKSIEGDYATEGLKLINFVNTLIEFIQKRNTERTLDQWRIFVLEYIDKLMQISEEKSDQLNYIINKISFPDQLYENIDKKISYEVFSKSLIDSLYSNTRSSKFISGQITFCSMIPMRSIPYKVVAILGLNN